MDDIHYYCYFIISLNVISVNIMMFIVYLVQHNWGIAVMHFVMTCFIMYICFINKKLQIEIEKIEKTIKIIKTKNPQENISNNNPILKKDLLDFV